MFFFAPVLFVFLFFYFFVLYFTTTQGMRFLHLHGIVHRDLKSLNVLLDAGWTAKISDFGLAKVTSTVAASTGGGGYHSKVRSAGFEGGSIVLYFRNILQQYGIEIGGFRDRG